MLGVVRGITIRSPRCRAGLAASATPWAWLPADAVTMPRARTSGRQPDDLVVGAAQLEREHGLQILALEEGPRTPSRCDMRGIEIERALDGDVVDARAEDLLGIIVHGCGLVLWFTRGSGHGASPHEFGGLGLGAWAGRCPIYAPKPIPSLRGDVRRASTAMSRSKAARSPVPLPWYGAIP